MVIRGFGLGAVTIPVMAVAFLGLDKEKIAHSSVVIRMAQQIGGSFGTAVLAVILSGAVTAHRSNLATGFDVAFWWATGFSVLAVLLALWLAGSPAPRVPRPLRLPASRPRPAQGRRRGSREPARLSTRARLSKSRRHFGKVFVSNER
jgi:hypothetical protein